MRLKELSKEFTKKGVLYSLLEKNETYVLYKCHDIDGKFDYWEVFKYRLLPPHPLDTGDWDMVEYYPSDNRFGIDAWCCTSEKSLNNIMLEKFGIEY